MTAGVIALAATVVAIGVVALAQWADRQTTGARMQEWRDRW